MEMSARHKPRAQKIKCKEIGNDEKKLFLSGWFER
jgi:hypothetical protein